ncbi:dihydroneopterin aldolase [Komagataeibacter nataicola]|uniref:7,8-dihydroneopterin aldolase n=1 Tax=Komagataeibacter nataicola TaxID=265960 RepID=A0A9N7C8L9_9PROT|nr:dihydroneopterin aldolase [Komagataeibacter nataicola]AQU86992.1 dihydroneopterin aldolase [Komagataeibacter nataicola]PYD68012.1 dihydroneopterin aldolase [Komagataeibacter nataicola]WEQ56053.1 dihydroneopterin aldolase [Komagataeibacter nataicola]WNM07674.1 dihydroneopterin aldolase [Komagataeibacter nataicola]GBR16793.1 dihydroneopterin aldolase [Komagataeibacter nataicola NRIC 0616]
MSVFPPWNEPEKLRCLFVRNMVLDAHIGVFEHEQGVTQRIRVNVMFGVPDSASLEVGADDLARTVSYEHVVLLVRTLVEQGHVALVETLAERIAAGVLAEKRVRIVRVSVEKLDIFDDAESVGVEIERRNPA